MAENFAEWVAGLGPGVANHLWQSTAFVAAAWLLTLALRRNQARVRYGVWLAASMKFLVPFSLLIAAGNLLPHPKQAVAPVVYSAMDGLEEPFADVTPQYAAPVAHVPTLRERAEAELPLGLFVVWMLGAGVVVLRWARGWRVVRRTLREAEVACEGREWEILRRLEAENTIELRLSAERMEPGVFGVGRPVLVWPRELSARLDDEHIAAILAHEMAHVRRRDNLTAALHMLVETVFWFHPAVWWMERQMVKEREQACDEAVVAMGGDEEIYAESLLKTCRFCIESPLVCVAGVTGADLRQRVMAIVTGRALLRMSWAKKALIAVVAVCVVAAPVVLGQAKAAQRLMLAAMHAAPRPVQTMAKAVMFETQPTSSLLLQPSAATEVPALPAASPFVLDVVSIRPSDPNVRGPIVFGPQPDGFMVLNMPLNTMLSLFYGPELQMDVNRIDGGPDWVRSSPWIIRAKIAQAEVEQWGKLVRDQSPAARSVRDATIQAMLESRFQLKTHFETREGTVYALVVAKGGLKMRESAPDERGEISAHGTLFTYQKASMSTILTSIAQQVGSPVVDKTGLTGNYDFTLDSTPLHGAPPPTDANASLDAPPSIFNAVEEQLGLKLVAQKGPVTHLVIDHVEKPSVDGAEVGAVASAALAPVAQMQEKGASGQAAQSSMPACPDGGLFAAYDVVSVRPTNAIPRSVGLQEQPDGIHSETVTVAMMVQQAYGADRMLPTDDAVSGLPDWGKVEYFAVNAKMNPEQVAAFAKLDKDQKKGCRTQMLQALLADRFKLQVHSQSRQVLGYELVVASGGVKMKEVTASDPDVIVSSSGKPMLKNLTWIEPAANGGQEVIIQNFPMDQLTYMLAGSGGVDHKVVNKTGLTGLYKYTLTYALPQGAGPAGAQAEATASDPAPALFNAVEDQLGLKLQRGSETVQIVVVDHVERPSEN